MVGMQARLPNCTYLKSRLTSPPRIWAHGCVWIIIFESSNKNTISTTTLNYGDHWDFDVSIFLKIDRLQVSNLTAPLGIIY